MPAQIEAVFGRNITLVYDALDFNAVDRNKLRGIFPGVTPTIMDMPDMIVAVYPPNPLLIQIGDRRIRVNLTLEIPELGDFPMWEYAEKCKDLIQTSKTGIIAYGYNFDFGVLITDTTIEDLLISKFVHDRSGLEKTLQGTLVSFLPRITFKNGNVKYDIVFEPFKNNRIKAHGNAHLQKEGIQLPEGDQLRLSYVEHFARLRSVILSLLTK